MTTTDARPQAPAPTTLRHRLRTDPRLGRPGWFLLPLRLFLGATFLYAGASKLLDPNYLDPGSLLGVRKQMLRAAAGSPISALVDASAAHATTTGLLIAFGELAVGLGLLLGLLTRLAAVGGLLLALSFFLTVSWQTTPYYTGADIAFVFAFTPLVLAGDGGVLSVTAAFGRRARAELQLPPRPSVRETEAVRNEVERRAVLRSGALAAAIGVVTVGLGGAVAFLRRGSTPTTTTTASADGAQAPASTAPTHSATPQTASTGKPAHAIVRADAVPVGSAHKFTAADGNPAYLLQPKAGRFTAYSAVCTHEGCPVSHTGNGFRCPCHGASYDDTGQVTGGPAPRPLARIAVAVKDGYVVAE